jgi:hypothetical protein
MSTTPSNPFTTYPCSYCGQPAHSNKREPRQVPWYGDHEECRRQARLETYLKADVKRGINRKGHKQ